MAKVVSLPFYYSCPAMKLTLLILLFTLLTTQCLAQSWSAPVLISDMPGINNNQDMCIDRAGTRHVVWSHTVSNGYWTIMYSKSTTGGMTWTPPDTIVNMPGAWLYEPHIVSDTLNNLYVSFDSISQGGGYGQIFYTQNAGNGWTSPIKVCTSNSSRTNKIGIDKNNRLYLFWHEIYNLNTKFVYRYLENGNWSDIVFPYTDNNVYVLENIDFDYNNNIHCIGYFNNYGQTSYNMVFFYSMFDYTSNSWSQVLLLNDKRINIGCDISCDSLGLPGLVWGQYTNSTLPYEYATIFKKLNPGGWGECDTITKEREKNQKIVIDKYNGIHIIDYYSITNTISQLNYYSVTPDGWSKEILDENASIIMFDIETSDQSVDIVYGKMVARPGPDTVRTYYINKSILVSLPHAVGKGQPLFVYPNPGNTSTTIGVDIQKPVPASLYLLDQSGKRIKTFFENKTLTQKTETPYNLTDNYGRIIPSGTYLLVLKSESFIHVKQFIKQ
jgi:hypothetical protein